LGEGSPTRNVSPLGAAATPTTLLSPEPPAISGLIKRLAPFQSLVPANKVAVSEVAFYD